MRLHISIPLEKNELLMHLEKEQNFLRGLFTYLIESNNKSTNRDTQDQQATLPENIVQAQSEIDKIYPLKAPAQQIKALQKLAIIFHHDYEELEISQIKKHIRWIELNDGYIGRIMERDFEIAILLFLVGNIYQNRALESVQTSPEYRYYHISALAAIKAAKAYLKQIILEEGSFQARFAEIIELKNLEIKAEITKSEAFLARKNGNFERAAKLFAGASSYRFTMMNYDLEESITNKLKIYASTELGMACFYLAVGLSNKKNHEKAYAYLLKAQNYFENTVKLSEGEKTLLEAANKRLELVKPYIERLSDENEDKDISLNKISDPQPLMVHPDPEAILLPTSKEMEIFRICSNCHQKISWAEKCPECKKVITPIK
ncbi:MAG: hypothetical protein U9O98_08575 [Asgard group archaeon]|nr:hypothetical protein [Asgard group archaeon]